MSSSKLTIVVPVYNEQGSLLRLKTETDKFLASNTISASVLFVNDGSTDASLDLIKKVSSLIANSFRRRVLVDGVKDTGCPLKILKTAMARKIPFFTGMHRFIPALIQIQGGTVKEIPVRHFPRLEGQPKYHLGNRIIKPFMDTLAVYWIKKRNISYHIIEKSFEQ